MAGYIGNTAAFLSSTSGADIDGTVTADGLTVDTTTLVVDSTNNRVGIGTISPLQDLHISSTSGTKAIFERTGSTGAYIGLKDSSGSFVYLGDNNGTFEVQTAGSSYSTKLAVTSGGNVGIGINNPFYSLVVSSGGASGIEFGPAYSGTANLVQHYSRSGAVYVDAVNDAAQHRFNIGGSEKMRIDSSGNVGIGTSSPNTPLEVTGAVRATNSGSSGYFYRGYRSGTTSAWYVYDSGTEVQMTVEQANPLWFGTSNTERMRIDSSGNVGIGTSSPSSILHLLGTDPKITLGVSGASERAYLQYDNTASLLTLDSDGATRFSTNNTEAMRIDSSGNILQTAAIQNSAFVPNTPSTWNAFEIFQDRGVTNAASGIAFRSESGTAPAGIVSVAGNTTGGIESLAFMTAAGNVSYERMRIDSNGNVGIGTSLPQKTLDVRGELAISNSTTSYWNLNRDDTDGSLTFTDTNVSERMRINSSGNLLVGTTSTGGGKCVIETTSVNQLVLSNKDTGADAQYAAYFLRNNSIVGSIQTSNTSSSFVTSSDHRLKENVTDVTDGITRVKQLAPKRFNFIADPDTTVDGFLAHEAQAVVPEAVTGTHNEVDNDGNPVYQGIDQAKLVPLLTAALKEAITKIEALEARLDALEGS